MVLKLEKYFNKLIPGDKAYIVNKDGVLVKELTFKFHGRNSLNFNSVTKTNKS